MIRRLSGTMETLSARHCDIRAGHQHPHPLIKNHPPAVAQRVGALPKDARLCMSFVPWAELRIVAERGLQGTAANPVIGRGAAA